MISVIIPTLWRDVKLMDRLYQLSSIPIIGEIILIDNTETPPEININKVLHIKEYKNTFVYAAFNKGVSLSKYDIMCIMNDDVDFDENIFKDIYPYVTEDKGMIGLKKFYTQYESTSNTIQSTDKRVSCYGCLFFIHKNSYIPIPEILKVWYGDDWLFHKNGHPNYCMDVCVWGYLSRTSNSTIFDKIKEEDAIHYKDLMK